MEMNKENNVFLRIEISSSLNDKLNWFTKNYSKELNGWLIGEFREECIYIEDILIPEQKVNGSSVDTSGSSLVKLRKEYGEKCSKIIGNWHSHNTMGVFWSGTDEEFIESYMEKREKGVFLVSSNKSKHLIRFELRKPIKLSIDSLDYNVTSSNLLLDKELEKVIKTKLKEEEICYNYSSNITGLKEVTLSNYGFNKEVERNAYEESEEILFKNYLKNAIYYDFNKKLVIVDIIEENILNELFYYFEEHKPEISSGCAQIVFKMKDEKKGFELIKEIKKFVKELIKEGYMIY